MAAPLEVTGDTFEAEVLGSAMPVLVDFWAAWCGPCKTMRPIIEEAAATFDQRLKVVTVDTEAQRPVADRFGVRGLPCLAIFKAGKMVEMRSGVAPRTAVMALLAKHAA